jgi:hypothetical protein
VATAKATASNVQTHKEATMSVLRTALLLALTGVAAPVLAEQITCESQNDRNEVCTTLQPGSSVTMVEQLSRAPCVEGRSWGADEGHIWVAAGCRARFDVRYDRAAYRDDDRGERHEERGEGRQYAREEHREAAREACIQQAAAGRPYGPEAIRAGDVEWVGEGQFSVHLHTPDGGVRCTVDRDGNVQSMSRR